MDYRMPLTIHSKDKSIVANDYVLIYHKRDGFSRRLLNADLLIGSGYTYELKLTSYEHQPATGKPFSLFISGNLSTNIREKVEYLLGVKKLNEKISSTYGKYMTDIGNQEFIIKHNKSVIRSTINLLDTEKFEQEATNPAEKEFIAIYCMLNDFIESIYNVHKNRQD